MIYEVSISAVDGETNFNVSCRDSKIVLEFLEQHDHEGSSVSLVIKAEDSEEVYKLLIGKS